MSKRKDFCLKEKRETLVKYDDSPKCSQREAVSKLGISQSVICSLYRYNIRVQIVVNANLNHKQMQAGEAENLEVVLLELFKNVKLKKILIFR